MNWATILTVPSLAALTLGLNAGCSASTVRPDAGSPQSDGGDAGTDGGSEPTATLTVTPTSAQLTFIDMTPGQVTFVATATTATGMMDVSDEADWSIDNTALGSFQGARFTTAGIPGTGTVSCRWKNARQTAQVSVRVEKSFITGAAPTNARALFLAAVEDGQLAPTIVYPSDSTVFPPNIGDLEAHWVDRSGTELFELTLSNSNFSISLYTTAARNAESWLALGAANAPLWAIVSAGARDQRFQLGVRAMKPADPSKAGTKTITLALSRNDLLGGIYYWSPSTPAGIYRHDFGKANSPPEQYYNNAHFPPAVPPTNACVGCHAISPNGQRVAFDYQVQGDRHWGTAVDTSTRQNLFPPSAALSWSFPTFEPSGQRLVTTSVTNMGILTLRNANTGDPLATIPTEGFATHPDFSPLGNAIAYTRLGSGMHTDEAQVSSGSVVVQAFDADGGTFGTPKVVASNAGTENNYYPSWSPDGEWILFNRSQAGSYFQPTAQLYVVRADGSMPPIALASANVMVGLTNSWPKFAPFVEKAADGRSLAWLTFSSTRPFGVRPKSGAQLWMAAFHYDEAARGRDPSSPAFRLPFQDAATSNHSAQWTQTIVEIN